MSVAFCRESDEEHKEPRFELPIPAGPNLVTAAGLRQAETGSAELEAAVAAEADEHGLAEQQRALRYWRTRLATAELAPPPLEGEAAFGSRVSRSASTARSRRRSSIVRRTTRWPRRAGEVRLAGSSAAAPPCRD